MRSNDFHRIRANLATEIIIAIISLVIAIASLSYTILHDRFTNYNFSSGKEITCVYKANNGKYIASGVAKPCKGSFYYSLMQSKGKKNCKYTLAYKKTSSGKYTTLTSGKTFSKNGVYTSPKKICRANGKTNYNFKMTKTAGKGTTSKVKVDWLIK